MKRKRFGVIGAMDSEIQHLIGAMTNPKTEQHADLTFYRGNLGDQELVLVKCGIGKVNAARCTQMLIDRYAPDFLINTGIAGGIGDGLHVGDLVIASELVQHDFDISRFGHARGYVPPFGDGKQASVFRSSEAMMQVFLHTVSAFLPQNRVRIGRIATGDLFVADAETKQMLKQEFSAIAVEMEGGAIAQTAEANGVPFLVVRAISDLADGTAAESFDAFEKETADLSARVTEAFIRSF